MKRLDKQLTSILLNARKEAKNYRKSLGIDTLDVFKELVEDMDGVLYEYLMAHCKEEIFSEELLNMMQELDARTDIEYEENIFLDGKNGKKTKVHITKELYTYLKRAEEVSTEGAQISINDLLEAIIESPPKRIVEYFRSTNIKFSELQEIFISPEHMKNANTIPPNMVEYLSVLEEDDSILGRDKEIDFIWTILMKKTKRNLVLVGEPGVGKTAIAKKMVAQIKNGTAPKEFKDFQIYLLDVTSVISGTKYRGEAEVKFQEIISFIKERQNAIIFIDEAHMLLGAGKTENSSMDFANSLKPILAGNYSRIIAATTSQEYKRYFSIDPAFRRRFEKVVVEEPCLEDVFAMTKSKIKNLSEYHGVKISREMVNFIILYASCFEYETRNPDRTLDLVDKAMATAKRKGKSAVDKESILANFKANLQAYKNMSYIDKKALAYHETGHYLAYRFLPYLRKMYRVVAVSIYPAENYLGLTVPERRKNIFVSAGESGYLQEIVACLVGGIAGNLVSDIKNDGVSSDSKEATRIAKSLIANTGLYDYFYQLDELKTEKSTNTQIKQVKEVISKAEKMATDLVNEHREELEAVANELLKKKVLSYYQLESIVSKVQKQKAASKKSKSINA